MTKLFNPANVVLGLIVLTYGLILINCIIHWPRRAPRQERISKCKVAKGGKLVGFGKPKKIDLDEFEKKIS